MNLPVAGAFAAALLLSAPAYAQPASDNPAPASNAAAAPDVGASAAGQSAPPATNAPAATAPTAPPATTPAVPPPTASAPPTNVPAKGGFVGADIPPPPPGKGEVVFFRPNEYVGWAVWFNNRENGKALGKLTNGVYFVTVADPGPHTYTAATENKDMLKLEVDPGEIYYVEGTVTMGVFVGEADISPSDQDEFVKAAHKLKEVKSADDSSASAEAGK